MSRQDEGVTPAGSGHSPKGGAASASPAKPSVPNAALAGADDWEVGPCVNHLGNVTSWDINVKPQFGDRGVVVIASVYSGEVVARAILAAVHSAAVEARREALTRMVQLDEELGLYDDEPVAASGTEAQRATTVKQGVVHDGPAPKGDAQ